MSRTDFTHADRRWTMIHRFRPLNIPIFSSVSLLLPFDFLNTTFGYYQPSDLVPSLPDDPSHCHRRQGSEIKTKCRETTAHHTVLSHKRNQVSLCRQGSGGA